MTFEEKIAYVFGERCGDYEPGCVTCDIWHAYDLHAYGAIRAELDDYFAWEAEWHNRPRTDEFDPVDLLEGGDGKVYDI